ncbi:MAG: hypothetical protein WC566_06395 [Dehalococcoidia bacterium]
MENEQYEESLLEERKSLIFAIFEQSKSFDRWILTLAGGTFGLSLVFINQIAPNLQSGTLGFLVTAWVLFAISILSTLLSFLVSQETHYKQIKDIHELLKGETDRSKELPLNIYGRITKGLNYCSMSTFVIGVAFLITFAALNLLSAKGG